MDSGSNIAASRPLEAPVEGIVRAPIAPLLMEVAWEVCNQVGGIYQVIRSKAPPLVERWGDRYCLVGPYEPAKAGLEFEAQRPGAWMGRAISDLASQGITAHHGRWLIPGKPRVILLEHWRGSGAIAAAKYDFWEHHALDFPGEDWLVDGVVSFSEAVFRLIKALSDHADLSPASRTPGRPAFIAHFHEWMAGLAIPKIRRYQLPVATVFTTHATLLGRYIASSEDDFYDVLPWIDHARAAERYNVRTQHSIERACAHGAHVFTTVSSVTAEECATLLGRTVDVVTPNGLHIGHYNKGPDQQRLHGESKELIHRFVMGHFFPSYSFDLDRSLYVFTSGRFEPKNKGFDLCLESMARLNAELKARSGEKELAGGTIVFFIVSNRPTRSLNPLALEKRGVFEELSRVCETITDFVEDRLVRRAAAGEKLKLDDLIDEYWQLRYRRTQQALRQPCLPMVTTHILQDDASDPVLAHMRTLGLFNQKDDPVKVVYHPEFITPTSPLWGMEYDQFVRGCHLGLFPSQYEPWGYTPLECAAMAVPSVTSDLAGFGRYVQENIDDHDRRGLMVLGRRGRSFHDAAADLASRLLAFCRLERRDRIMLRNQVDRASWEFDWSRLVGEYDRAYTMAVDRAGSPA